MPQRRKKTYKKKPARRRKTNVVKQPQVVANSQITTLRYVDFVNLDPGINVNASDTWYASSIFDPYVAAGGHQPLGADQWATFYNHYTVLGAKCTAYCDVYGTVAGDAIVLTGKLTDKSVFTPTTVNHVIEENKSKWRFLTAKDGSKSSGSVTLYYSPKKFFNLKNVQDEHDLRGITGDSGTNPTENAYFHVAVGGMNPADNPTACNVRVVIEYRVLFTERKDLAQS